MRSRLQPLRPACRRAELDRIYAQERRIPRCVGVAVAFAMTLMAGSAFATSASIPPECGSLPELELELRRHLGSKVSLDRTDVTIWGQDGEYRLRVRVGSEQRELKDESCRELFRAAVVVAVAMLVPDAAKRSAQRDEGSSPDRLDSTAASPSPLLGVSLGAGLSLSMLPAPVLALELEGKALWQSFGLAAGAHYLAPGDTVDAKRRGVTLQALGAGLHGLWRPERLWEARLGLRAYLLFGEGLGSPSLSSGSAWAGGPVLGLAFAPLQSPPFWGGVGAEAQINVLRAQFEILEYKRVFEVPQFSGSAFARVGVLW